jgi:outer membrane protein OmpA-like peptidoglycan-associated protein
MAKKQNFFWASYADLMTSLFFIMLVLFVLVIAMMKKQQKATEEQLSLIKNVQSAVKALPDEFFTYQNEYKRFSLNRQIQFLSGKSEIASEDKNYLTDVGRSVENLIINLKTQYQNQDIRYIIIIEGMASNDNYIYNHELSYQRALALLRLWEKSGISFDNQLCELQIAGSGTSGIGRYSGKEEFKNQRFLIQIIPKIGNLE